MKRVWLAAVMLAAAAAFVVLFLNERPLTVTVVRPESDVALRIYGLGTVEARILSRVGFEVGGRADRTFRRCRRLRQPGPGAGHSAIRRTEGAAGPRPRRRGGERGRPCQGGSRRLARPGGAGEARGGEPSPAGVDAARYRLAPARRAVEQEACIIAVTHDEKIFDRFDRLIHLRDGSLVDA